MTDQTTAFIPPAADGIPLAALDSATEGANRLDARAATPWGRNFLAHALNQLARDGWLRRLAAQPQADRIAELESVLRCLASPEPCDWQGDYCRTHGWKSDLGVCPHGKAQTLLAVGECW